MGKVVNSVKQICAECDSILSITDDCEYVDVLSLAQTLREEKSNLLNIFTLHPENTMEIDRQKSKVESIAIRLEFYISTRLRQLSERYSLREEAVLLYDFCRQVTLDVAEKGDKENLLTWSKYTKWALQFYARSTHILFELDEEDKLNLNTLRHIMNTERK